MSPTPKLGSRWSHHKNKGAYRVYDITNEHSRTEKYPPSVSYVGRNGKRWSKPISLFYETMIPIEKDD